MLPLLSLARTTAIVLALSGLYAPPAANASPATEPSASVAPRTHTVKIKGMVFVPEKIEVSVGDTVVWVNEDFVPHTATAIVDGAKVFDSGVFQPKASWKYVAGKPGTIPYGCLLHPMMKGTLIVR